MYMTVGMQIGFWAGVALFASGVVRLMWPFLSRVDGGGEVSDDMVQSCRPESKKPSFAPRGAAPVPFGTRVDLTSSVKDVPIKGNWAVVCELLDGYPSRAMFVSRSGRQRVTAPVVRCDGKYLYLRHGQGRVFKRRMLRNMLIRDLMLTGEP